MPVFSCERILSFELKTGIQNSLLIIQNYFTLSGGDSGGVTPDPIPNSVVKPFSADGTARFPAWESRTLPEFFFNAASARARAVWCRFFENQVEQRNRMRARRAPARGLVCTNNERSGNGPRVQESKIIGEFDPGSERTLAACLTHASRTRGGLPSRVAHG